MADILTDNWHLYPLIQTLRKIANTFQAWLKICRATYLSYLAKT